MRGGRYRIACAAKSNSDGSADFVGARDAEPPPDVAERAVHRQRGRRQHRRPHAIEQQLADDRDTSIGAARRNTPRPRNSTKYTYRHRRPRSRNLTSSRSSPARRTSVGSLLVDRRLVPIRRPLRVVGRLPAASASATSSDIERAGQVRGGCRAVGQRRVRRTNAFLAAPRPAARWAKASSVKKRPRRDRAGGRALASRSPCDRSTPPTPPAARRRGASSSTPVVADAVAEVLRGDVLELVRLVDDRVAAGGNDLAEGALADRGIGAQQW